VDNDDIEVDEKGAQANDKFIKVFNNTEGNKGEYMFPCLQCFPLCYKGLSSCSIICLLHAPNFRWKCYHTHSPNPSNTSPHIWISLNLGLYFHPDEKGEPRFCI